MIRSFISVSLALVPAVALTLGWNAPAEAQGTRSSSRSYAARAAVTATMRSDALAKGRYAVVVDLDHNLLHFRQGEHTLWSAQIGTGTGLRMKDEEQSWDFSTPNGVFQVEFKERDPVWIAEDWYYVENGLPIPPPDDPKRYFPGGLGAAAVYISHDLAIHGTDKPELLGQRVSHGCIRLSNKDALRLFHNVQVGTEVVIVGGRDLPQEDVTPREAQRLAAAFKPSEARKATAPRDPLLEAWQKMSSDDLVLVLQSELWENPARSRWSEVTHLLSDRGLDGDEEALTGLLAAGLELPSAAVEREYRTYLADAFARGTRRTLDALSGLASRDRARIAAMIVDATMDLYSGELDEATAPWPTRRIPSTAVNAAGRSGWAALRQAEESFETRVSAAPDRPAERSSSRREAI